MARPYIPDSSTITPGFPGAVFTPWPTLDRKTDHDQRVETFNWPGSDNNYTIRLDAAILEHATITVLGDGDGLLPVRWTDSPGAGEVAVHHNNGLVRCHPSLATKSGSITYTPLATPVDAQLLATMQQEIKAAQTSAGNPPVQSVNGETGAVVLDAADVGAASTLELGNLEGSLDNHTEDTNNPHDVTKAQVGLGNADNTSDLSKPISTATQSALDGKQAASPYLSNVVSLPTSGIVGKSGSVAFARSIAAGAGISVSNGNGVAGNPTVSVDSTVARNSGKFAPGFRWCDPSIQSSVSLSASTDYIAMVRRIVGTGMTITLPGLGSVSNGQCFIVSNQDTIDVATVVQSTGGASIVLSSVFATSHSLPTTASTGVMFIANLTSFQWNTIIL